MPFLLLSDHSLFALRTLPPIVCLRVCVRVLLVECVLPGLTVLVLATSPLPHGTILASACAACASSFRSRVRRCCFESLPGVPAACGFPAVPVSVRSENLWGPSSLLRRVQRPSSSRNRLENEYEMMTWLLLLLLRLLLLLLLLLFLPRPFVGHYSRTDPHPWRTWSV